MCAFLQKICRQSAYKYADLGRAWTRLNFDNKPATVVYILNGKISKGFGLTQLIGTARTAMSRRKVEMTADDEALLRHVFALTKEDRTKYVKRARKAGQS